MLDPDRQIYYLQNDNATIASVDDILNDPSIVARAGKNPLGDDQTAWAKLSVENASSLRYVDSDFLGDSGLSLVLRPHEQLTIHSENRAGIMQSYFTPPLPLFFQNANSGQLDWDLSFGDSDWRSQVLRVRCGCSNRPIGNSLSDGNLGNARRSDLSGVKPIPGAATFAHGADWAGRQRGKRRDKRVRVEGWDPMDRSNTFARCNQHFIVPEVCGFEQSGHGVLFLFHPG